METRNAIAALDSRLSLLDTPIGNEMQRFVELIAPLCNLFEALKPSEKVIRNILSLVKVS